MITVIKLYSPASRSSSTRLFFLTFSFKMLSAYHSHTASTPLHTLPPPFSVSVRPGVRRSTWRMTRRERDSWVRWYYVYASLISFNIFNNISFVSWSRFHVKIIESHTEIKLLLFLTVVVTRHLLKFPKRFNNLALCLVSASYRIQIFTNHIRTSTLKVHICILWRDAI